MPPSGGGWTAGSALRRALEVTREEGPRPLWFRVLGELCYRRLALFELPLESPPPQPPSGVPLRIAALGDHDTSALRPACGEDEIARRRAAGQECWVARSGDEPLASVWIARGGLWTAYLGCHVSLATDEICAYEVFTTPAARGRNVAPAMGGEIARVMRERGYSRALTTVVAENRAGVRLVEKVGFRRIGTIGYVRFGTWRRDFCHMESGARAPGAATVEVPR